MADYVAERNAITEPRAVRAVLTMLALIFVGLVLVVPLVTVFVEAFRGGIALYAKAVVDPVALKAIRLTLVTAAASLVLNTVFGFMAAWTITRYQFRGKSLLVTLIDLPFTISPVISGLMFILLFGSRGLFGPWLNAAGLQIVFATPGIVLATVFVTFPFVARELIPLMQEQGSDEEEAALLLGAGVWKTILRVTLPNIKWGLLYGAILCNARAMGEFGAVSVVSGHIRGVTNTLPLHIEILYNEYQFSAAFAVATLLTFLALLTLVLKAALERRTVGSAARHKNLEPS